MYLSMWIIKRGLKDFQTEAHIQDGEMTIRNASLLSNAERTRPHTVYVAPSEDFIPSLKNKTICVNRKDYIIVDSNNLAEVLDTVELVIDFFMEWDLRVREEIDGGYTLQDIASEAAPVLQRFISVANSGFIYLAVAGLEYSNVREDWKKYVQPGTGMPLSLSLKFLKTSQRFYRQEEPYYAYYDDICLGGIVQNLKNGDQLWGYTVLGLSSGDDPLEISDYQLLNVFSHQVNYWRHKNSIQMELSEQEKILQDIMHQGSAYSEDEVNLFFQRLSWEKTDEKYVCIISDVERGGFHDNRVKNMVDQMYPGCMELCYQQKHLLLINARQQNIRVLTDALCELFEKTIGHIGVSYSFVEWKQMRAAMHQAETAVQMARQLRRTMTFCSDYFLEYVRSLLLENMGSDFVHPKIRSLLQYDQDHTTAYCSTLKSYLENERSLVKTAAAMNIHVNTLKYRMSRIQDLLNLDLEDRDLRDSLRVSFALLENSF